MRELTTRIEENARFAYADSIIAEAPEFFRYRSLKEEDVPWSIWDIKYVIHALEMGFDLSFLGISTLDQIHIIAWLEKQGVVFKEEKPEE